MEANAENNSRLKRLIGMLRTIAKQVLLHNFFCAICQTALPDSPFDTRILYGKKTASLRPLT